jgi:hypothetical protein
VAGRQGGARETVRDNECNSKSEKNRFEECHLAPGIGTEKGYLAPEAKMANKIACDHVCDKP